MAQSSGHLLDYTNIRWHIRLPLIILSVTIQIPIDTDHTLMHQCYQLVNKRVPYLVHLCNLARFIIVITPALHLARLVNDTGLLRT